MKVLIGGGTGFLGRNLHKALLNRGHTVEIISRTKPKTGRYTWSQLEDEGSLPDCDALVNLSGEYILNTFRRWNEAYKRDVYESRVKLNELLVKLMVTGSTKPNVWVSGHAEGYYPRCETMEYNEDFVMKKPQTYAQGLCEAWEKSSMLPEHEKIRHVLVRTGVVLGNDGGLIEQSYWPFWLALGGSLGSGSQILPWIHIRDITNLFVHAIENNNVSGPLNGVSPGYCTSAEFTSAFGKALNRPTVFSVPSFAIKWLVGEERAGFMLEGVRIKPKRSIESGFKFEFTDIKKAMQDIVG
ncbi:epimerase family protein SDR39U1-like [Hydractinia symbiolongicarpus]|uniref:epimerase family protein SDR39U1-like n=1 Tax=Hydractinia symbiolongicarpus TaxID=13093 RepID=UPI00254C7C5D|nr:epimerase family protein SDR39U1-like [Hydractinia symbiolongicarpus]